MEVFFGSSVGVVPIADDSEHFAVAALGYDRHQDGRYGLHVYRSDRGTWTKTPLALETHVYSITKVVALGGGVLSAGWTSARASSSATCSTLTAAPTRASSHCPRCSCGTSPNNGHSTCTTLVPRRRGLRRWRHQVCRDGSLLQAFPRCQRGRALRHRPAQGGHAVRYQGWRIVTWTRTASDDNCLRKAALLHADDIVIRDNTLLRRIEKDDSDVRLRVRLDPDS